MGSRPKKPKPTAEEKATERRQTILLDKEIEESERRFKALARGKLGRVSLLSGAATTPAAAAAGGRRGGAGGTGSLLGAGGGTGGAPAAPATAAPRNNRATQSRFR